MRTEEIIIKLAKEIVSENNKIYKMSAKERAFIIYATDGSGTQDRFITTKNLRNEMDWKNQFESVGFTNVVVRPFGTNTLEGVSGDLDFSEVTVDLFTNSTNRPKINYLETPNRANPYKGSQDIPADARLSAPSCDDTNELQKFIFDTLEKNDEARIRAGWYGGPLVDWLKKLEADSEGESIKKILEAEYPYMNNTMLEKHLLDRQLSLADYEPTKYEIRYFAIVMASLMYYISQPGVDFVDVPENRVKEKLKEIIQLAQSFKKHKHYGGKEMGEYFDEHQNKLMKRQDDTKDAIHLLMKGMFK